MYSYVSLVVAVGLSHLSLTEVVNQTTLNYILRKTVRSIFAHVNR